METPLTRFSYVPNVPSDNRKETAEDAMHTRNKPKTVGIALMFLAVSIGIGILAVPPAEAQQQSSALFSVVTGNVRFMNKGDASWQMAQVGMRVTEGADVVAEPGSNAELRLPDGSTVLVAENTRFIVTKLDFDSQNRMRESFFHLATGKLRAIVSKAAASLVASRHNNFAITTPTAVAAVRGTTLYAIVDAATGATSFLCTEGTAVVQVMVAGRMQTVTITAGQMTTVALGQAPTPPSLPTAAQQAAITSPNVATTGAGTTVLNASVTQISVPSAASVTVTVDQAIAAALPGTPLTAPALESGPSSITVQPNNPITPTDVSTGRP